MVTLHSQIARYTIKSYCLLQNMQIVPVSKDQYGNFYEGDSYIVYAASDYGKPVAADSKVGCNANAVNIPLLKRVIWSPCIRHIEFQKTEVWTID